MASVMLDILNRPIKEGDIVIVKGNGGYGGYQKSMEVGIRIGESIRTLSCSRNPSDKFLVENPGTKELEIKDEIYAQIAAKKAKSAKKAAEASKLKADIPGTIYMVSRYNEAFIYLGKVKIEGYFDDIFGCSKEGKVYVSLETWVKDKSKYVSMNMEELKEIIKGRYLSVFDTNSLPNNFEFIKTNKTYQEVLGKVSDFDPNFEVSFDCTCTINGAHPYEKGHYKFSKI